MLQIADTTVRAKEIVLADDGQHVYIGHNAILDSCKVHLRINRKSSLTVAQSRFSNCEFFADLPLRGVEWVTCAVEGCKFYGRFENNRFGYWPEHFRSGDVGSIDACDFSDAELHLCEFFGCDMTHIVLPRWPCFTIIKAKEFFETIARSATRPEWVTYWDAIDGEISRRPSNKVLATTYHAPTEAEWLSRRKKVTAMEMRNFLQGHKGIVM